MGFLLRSPVFYTLDDLKQALPGINAYASTPSKRGSRIIELCTCTWDKSLCFLSECFELKKYWISQTCSLLPFYTARRPVRNFPLLYKLVKDICMGSKSDDVM